MTTRPIEHRTVLNRPFADVCTVVYAHTEEMLQRATASASRHVVELVHAEVEPLPGFDSSEPVTIFRIDPDRDPDRPTSDEILASFATAWSAGDRPDLTALSNESATVVARDWDTGGLTVEVVDPITDLGGELLVSDPGSGSALISKITFEDTTGTTRIADLSFGGDAGGSAEPPVGEPEEVLTVTHPAPGDLFTSVSTIRGQTTSGSVDYLLTAGGSLLAEGTAPASTAPSAPSSTSPTRGASR